MKIPPPKKTLALLCALVALVLVYCAVDAVFFPRNELTIRSDAEWGIWEVKGLEEIREVNPKFTSWTYCGGSEVDYFGNCPNGNEGEQHPGDFTVVRHNSMLDLYHQLADGNDFSRYIRTTFDHKATSGSPVGLSTRCYFLRDMGTHTDEYGYKRDNVDSLPGIYLDLRKDGYTFATALGVESCSIRVYQVPPTQETLEPGEDAELVYEARNDRWPAKAYHEHSGDDVDAVELQLSYDRSYLIQHGPHSFILRIATAAKFGL